MGKVENYFLFLVVLGGRAKKSNIELHDVRWVVGSKIEDTYDTLRRDWFGSPKGLHIDSFKKIKYIDGYKINLLNFEKDNLEKKHFNLNSSDNVLDYSTTYINVIIIECKKFCF